MIVGLLILAVALIATAVVLHVRRKPRMPSRVDQIEYFAGRAGVPASVRQHRKTR